MIDIGLYKLPTGDTFTYNKNLYILGTSSNGPVLEPVLIKTPEQAESVFGDYNDGTLVKAYKEAYHVGRTNINIYLVRVTGSHAEITLYGENFDTMVKKPYLTLKSKNGGEIWNDMRAYITDSALEVMSPLDVGGEVSVFSFEEYPTIELLVQEINLRARNGEIPFYASTTVQFCDSKDLAVYYNKLLWQGMNFNYGEDGINISKNQLHDSLEIAYNILEGQPIDVLCIAEAYFDDVYPSAYYGDKEYGKIFFTASRDYLTKPHPSQEDMFATFHGQMIDFCERQASLSIITHGVMAFNPVENLNDIVSTDSYFTKAIYATSFAERFDLITKSGEKVIDHGKFISVIAGEFEYDINGYKYYNNGYLGYAAMIAGRLTAASTTNKAVPNISNIRYHIDDSEIVKLSKLGVVTFRYSVMKKTIVVCNGVTAAIDTSPYHTLSNMRMIQLVTTAFRTTMESFIGEDVMKLKATSSMEKAIDSLAKQLRTDGIVRDIKHELTLSESGFAIIKLDILAYYSLEYVSATGSTKL